MSVRECEFVVVGSGAAGSVVAGRLARETDDRVVLIEAGGPDGHPLTTIPGIAFLASVSPRRNWNFLTEPIPALGGRRMAWNQGRILGGGSSINGMIYMRGHSREYDQWRQAGCTGWGFDEVLPFYRKSESSARGAGRWHGGDGPIATRPSHTPLPICAAFLEAAGAAGFPVVEDLNADVAEGFGRFDINVRDGRRVSAATGYVRPALGRPNFTVLTGALARRVIVRGGRAWGVEIARGGKVETVRATREVIVSCGAVNSPQLLLLSGIGPADELRALGIDVVADLPQVGHNLHNHPAYTLRYACHAPVTAYRYARPLAALGLAARYAFGRRGPLGESYVAQGGVFRTDPGLEIANSIVVMAPALVERGRAGESWRSLLPHRHGFAVSVSVGRPASRGTVRLRSADPAAPPSIQPNYLSDPADVASLVRGVERVREIMRQAPVRDAISEELSPGPAAERNGLEAEIRAGLGSYSHPGGTCRMGGDASSVVDPQLRVRGIEGLRVADASIMPGPLNACTHAPSLMIGEKAAAMVMADRQGSASAPFTGTQT